MIVNPLHFYVNLKWINKDLFNLGKWTEPVHEYMSRYVQSICLFYNRSLQF